MNVAGIVWLSILAAIIIYIMVFSIIDRICKCVENVAKLKTYGEVVTNGDRTSETSEKSSKADA